MDPAVIFVMIFLFLLGAVVGSFLNVVIYRGPRGESISHPRSHCPRCGRMLQTSDLIPMLSWVALRGRCRTCGVRISPRYFMVELLTALLFLGAYLPHPFSVFDNPSLAHDLWGLAHRVVLVGLFVPIIFIDEDHKIVPDELSVPLLLVGLAWNVVEGLTGGTWSVDILSPGLASNFSLSLPNSVVFACVCAGIFWLIQWFGEIVFHREAMGLGDVNIAAGIGANLPLLASLCSFAIAIGVGALIGVILILLGKRERTDLLAFGPMLLTGALIMLLFPGPVERWVCHYRQSLGSSVSCAMPVGSPAAPSGLKEVG
jgi:leader peptidase (prepilin peptidase)/N-methyltransferase